jgi:hypothetical protein
MKKRSTLKIVNSDSSTSGTDIFAQLDAGYDPSEHLNEKIEKSFVVEKVKKDKKK